MRLTWLLPKSVLFIITSSTVFFFLSFYFIFKQKVKNRIFPLLFFFIIISYKLTLSKLKVFFFARSSDCFTWKLKNMVMSDVSTVDN
jgi:hypothetical protein